MSDELFDLPQNALLRGTQLSDAVLPRTTAAAAGRGPEPEMQTSNQKSVSEQRTDRWPRLPQRGFEETSSRFATTASDVAPCIWRP